MKKTRPLLFLILVFFGLTGFYQKQSTENLDDFKKYYDQFKVEGSFVFYDQRNDKFTFYNQSGVTTFEWTKKLSV